MNNGNPNAAAAEIGIKIISSNYSKPQASGDSIPPQVILLKFKHSNNMQRMELGWDKPKINWQKGGLLIFGVKQEISKGLILFNIQNLKNN